MAPFTTSEIQENAHTSLEDEARRQQKPLISTVARPIAPMYDPRQLLNPKSFDSGKRTQKDEGESALTSNELGHLQKSGNEHSMQFVFDSPSLKESRGRQDEADHSSMAHLIERVHNVSQREDHPAKRLKTDHVTDEELPGAKRTFTGGGKDGEIGEYMKQKRKEGQAEMGPVSTIVDLTEGKSSSIFRVLSGLLLQTDDDEISIVQKPEHRIVCYGRVENARISAHSIPTPNPKTTFLSKTDWPTMKLELHRYPGKNNIIRVLDPAEKDFGNVDVKTAMALVHIMDSKFMNVRIQARLDSRKKKNNEFPGMPCSEYYNATINLYGPRSIAASIGKFLQLRMVHLKAPYGVDKGVEIFNPQTERHPILPRTNLAGMSIHSSSVSVARTAEEIRDQISGMFDTLEKSENLPEMEPDSRIITPLLSHQKQGLYFMTRREKPRIFTDKEEDKNSLWRIRQRPNGHVSYQNIITGVEERDRPPEVLGGILADMMGLGKTLSILSLVVGSMEEALEWAKLSLLPSNGRPALRNSKTTLLIAPLSVISNWEEQITAHFEPGSLSYYIYHGTNRLQNVDILAAYDMVLTTYSIISSECYGRSKKRDTSPLLQTNFFRIVLDEAHTIRDQTTRQSQAICSLSAGRRWAVTGTPVQNRLDDLGALIKFLRIKPFDDKGGFSHYILAPFKDADPEILPKLRLLVDSITLRRLKDRIDLPKRNDMIVRLQFSKEERELYEWFAKDSDNRMRIITGGKKKGLGGKTYVHVLQAILRLRLICAHGKELLSEDDLRLTQGFSSENAIDLEDEEDDRPLISKRQAYEMLMLFKETDSDKCSQCLRKIGRRETSMDDGREGMIGCMLPCFQMLCNECTPDTKEGILAKVVDNHFTCPFCEQYLRVSFFDLTQGGIEDAEDAKMMARENPRQAKIMGRYGGPHTKTTALIAGLLESRTASLAKPTEPPIKSVIFSGWTAHLDLIQIALEDNEINYVRLDGKMSRTQRSASLQAFREDPNIPVILVSISAGGLGLNLTTASMVYVMEPQFNPAAEAQAVDRVHRLGQKREVTITRFIMHESFEEKMLVLQRKKQDLAALSVDRGKLDKAEIAKKRLEDLRSLFK